LTKNIHTGQTTAEIYMQNSEKGQAMAFCPVCTYNGVDVPCFVCASPKASITTDLLIEMLAVIDKTGLFPRNGEKDLRVWNPYILWTTCISVPYGTHMWQPADSSKINGSFKMSLNWVKTFI
jgi:hypothetical protein